MTEEKPDPDKYTDTPTGPAQSLRRRAESQRDTSPGVLTEQSSDIDKLSPEEVGDLVHDLQVHQFELEMQNEELRRVQQQLEASRDRYADLYDFAPVGYFTLSEASLILEANLTAAAVLGVERGHLIQQPLTRFIVREDQDTYYFHRRQLFETRSPQVCEIRLIRADGSKFHARLEAVLVQHGSEGQSLCRVTLSDVSQRVRAQEELKRLNEELEDRVERRTRALHRRATELEAVVNVSSALREAVSVEETISILMEETVDALEAEAATILLLEDGALVVAGLSGPPRTLLRHRHLPCNDPLWQVVNTGQPILLNSVEQAGLVPSQLFQDLAGDMTAVAIVPLRASEETLGLLHIAFSQPDRPFDEYRRPLTAIGEMGGSALQRVRATETLERLVRDRTRDLAALYEVTTTTTQHLDTQIILESVLEQALEVTGADAGVIHLLDEGGETVRTALQRGLPPELMAHMQAEPLSASLWGQVVERKETVVVPDLASDLPKLRTLYPSAFPAYIGVPIHTTGRVLGVLSVFGEAIQKFSAEDIALLAAIANHVGVAVESAQLRQRAEHAAVMEERQRLARELHDSVTQSLYSLTLFAEAGMDSARAADLGQIEHYLSRIGENALQALKGMRLLIFELRPLALSQEGLVGALRQRLEAVERRAGVEAQLVAETPFELPAHVETGLYRIAQEALNNVLRHSAATRVTVRIGADDDGLLLEVIDNGQGFELGSVGDQGGMGLASMQERVEMLAGSLQIVSKPGQGTSIQIAVPWARSA
jgi:PAS domain S-box-containing protein